jgi:hypothetical protein
MDKRFDAEKHLVLILMGKGFLNSNCITKNFILSRPDNSESVQNSEQLERAVCLSIIQIKIEIGI